MLLRGTLDNEWSPKLKIVTDSLNNTPIKKLGWLRPNDITTEADSVLVDSEKRKHHIIINKEPDYLTQQQNEENYADSLKVGDFVYKDFTTKLFDKSFDVSVRNKCLETTF